MTEKTAARKRLDSARRYNEERRLKRGAEKYKLKLTADELDWLLLEILEAAAVNARAKGFESMALDIRNAINQWREQASEQGYEPF